MWITCGWDTIVRVVASLTTHPQLPALNCSGGKGARLNPRLESKDVVRRAVYGGTNSELTAYL
jgi:hypothetical protein